MIHDAEVEVTCDNPNCTTSIRFELEYVYHSYSGKSDSDDDIEELLVEDEDWVVIDGSHYCSEECAEEAKNERE